MNMQRITIEFTDGTDKHIAGPVRVKAEDGILTVTRNGWSWNFPLINVKEWSNL